MHPLDKVKSLNPTDSHLFPKLIYNMKSGWLISKNPSSPNTFLVSKQRHKILSPTPWPTPVVGSPAIQYSQQVEAVTPDWQVPQLRQYYQALDHHWEFEHRSRQNLKGFILEAWKTCRKHVENHRKPIKCPLLKDPFKLLCWMVKLE